jgi:hypothetical protein
MPITRDDAVELIQLLRVDRGLRNDLQSVLMTPDAAVHLDPHVGAPQRLQAALDDLSVSLVRMSSSVDRLADAIGWMQDWQLESQYARKVAAVFGRHMRRTRLVELVTIEDELLETLSREEMGDLYAVDLVVTGTPWDESGAELWLAIEVSAIVDRGDVERSLRRRELLSRTGRPCLAVVAGDGATEGAHRLALREAVVMVQDGRVLGWDEARARWLG